MQATVVILIALGGLGCQNPVDEPRPIPTPAVAPVEPAPGPLSYGPSSWPVPETCLECRGQGGTRDGDSFGRCLRDTVCSFVIGRSPDVPSAREIEAAYCAGRYRQ